MNVMNRSRNWLVRNLPFASTIAQFRRRRHVAMIHIGRSGSTVIGDLLNQHRKIAWDGEIYQEIFKQRERPDRTLPPILDVDSAAFARGQSLCALAPNYGFEVKFFHLRALGTQLAPYLDAIEKLMPGLSYVVLERKNSLRVVVSTLAARATGAWHLKQSSRAVCNRVHVDPNAVFVNRVNSGLLELLREFEQDFSELRALLGTRDALHLTYECDVMADPQRAYAKICRHIGLVPTDPPVRLRRTNPFPMSDIIENFEEVEALLRGTQFEWMLYAP